MIFMFTLLMLMLLMVKDGVFCLLQKLVLFLLCSLFSSKNPFNFFRGGLWGGGSIHSTSRGGKGSMILDGIREGERGGQESTVLNGTFKMYGP